VSGPTDPAGRSGEANQLPALFFAESVHPVDTFHAFPGHGSDHRASNRAPVKAFQQHRTVDACRMTIKRGTHPAFVAQ
jgi:hypothetical protein